MRKPDDIVDDALVWAGFQPAKPPRVALPVLPVDQRAAFSRNTGLALESHREILEMPLSDDDPLFRSKLQAKSMAANNQIANQLKADEHQLKAVELHHNYYQELRDALDAYYAEEALEPPDDQTGHNPSRKFIDHSK